VISAQRDLISEWHVLNKQAGRRVQVKSESYLLRVHCVDVAKKRM